MQSPRWYVSNTYNTGLQVVKLLHKAAQRWLDNMHPCTVLSWMTILPGRQHLQSLATNVASPRWYVSNTHISKTGLHNIDLTCTVYSVQSRLTILRQHLQSLATNVASPRWYVSNTHISKTGLHNIDLTCTVYSVQSRLTILLGRQHLQSLATNVAAELWSSSCSYAAQIWRGSPSSQFPCCSFLHLLFFCTLVLPHNWPPFCRANLPPTVGHLFHISHPTHKPPPKAKSGNCQVGQDLLLKEGVQQNGLPKAINVSSSKLLR